MPELNRDRPAARPSLPPSAPASPAEARPGVSRRPAFHEPTLEEMFTDPIFHLLLRRDRLTVHDVLGVIADARQRMRAS